MSRPSGIIKSDSHAKEIWGGDVYAAIPKSVFASVAWHLANLASGEADNPGAAEKMFLNELAALGRCGIIPTQQMALVINSISKAIEAPQ